ncbi:PTS glucose transporter subunit IIA [Chitinibacter bivalviorum]|uniref:PTS system glucose-specific EIIA component n=1 Tax=Chitinibacter bivalviorum TaxID=2739434 RepID=A0A7H9BIX4_9NEIS|nr:glucose PTS transporter subunit IIA [Chitinibacter bivalviorum]QLG87514.1 PTS glucose transporter subunit IIA [Chitinibacter bivalviorum]
MAPKSSNPGEIVLLSPLTGEVVALENVPDAAFATKAVGDGVAILPTGNLVVAPCDGQLVKIFNTNHAFALINDAGVELIVHIGIETVKLGGQGFTRLAEQGSFVKAGQPVLELDLEYLGANAKSMISPIVLTNADQFAPLTELASGSVIAGQTALYTIKQK